MRSYNPWTTKDERFLKENYRVMPRIELAKKMGRTVDSIHAKAKRLGLRKRNTLYRVVKDDEVIAIGTSDELAKRLKVSKKTIHEYSTPSHIKNGFSFQVEKAGVEE